MDKQHKDKTSKNEDPTLKDMVKHLIEMTQRSEEEVCLALHECDNDITRAVELLIDGSSRVSITTRNNLDRIIYILM